MNPQYTNVKVEGPSFPTGRASQKRSDWINFGRTSSMGWMSSIPMRSAGKVVDFYGDGPCPIVDSTASVNINGRVS